MPSHVEARLATHPRTAGYDTAALVDALLSALDDKRRPIASALESLSEGAVRSWLSLSSEWEQPVALLLRNLVASATATDLDAFALVIGVCCSRGWLPDCESELARVAGLLQDHAPFAAAIRPYLVQHRLGATDRKAVRLLLERQKGLVSRPVRMLRTALATGRFDTPGLPAALERLPLVRVERAFITALKHDDRRRTLVEASEAAGGARALKGLARRLNSRTLKDVALQLARPAGQQPVPAPTREALRAMSLEALARHLRRAEGGQRLGALGRLSAEVEHWPAETIDAVEAAFRKVPGDIATALFKGLRNASVTKQFLPRPAFLALGDSAPSTLGLLQGLSRRKFRALASHLATCRWSAKDIGQLLQREPKRMKTLLGAMLEVLHQEPEARIALLDRVAQCDIDLALSLVRKPRRGEVEALLAAAGKDAAAARAVLARTPRRTLSGLVRRVDTAWPTPPRGFVQALCEPVSRHLLVAVQKAPAAFVGPALKATSLETLLPVALKHPAVARELQRKATRAKLRRAIPWARSKWGRAPRTAAAYELALAASLVSARYIEWLAYRTPPPAKGQPRGHAFDDLYHVYQLPKAAGGHRTITAPDARLKRLQRRLLAGLLGEARVHQAATGFRPGQSVVTNAAPHVGKRLVVNVDIERFFDTTRYERIISACRRATEGLLSPRAAFLLADICTYDGHLPTGAPTSPVLANVILAPVDRALAVVAARHGIAYTRYADDLTFSGGDNATKIIPFARRLLRELGYHLDADKTMCFRRGRRQMVTGLVVNDKPNLPRRVRRRLRAAVHVKAQAGIPRWHDAPMSDAQLVGRLAQLKTVQPAEYARLTAKLRAARPAGPTETES
jgi:hypothetical protein